MTSHRLDARPIRVALIAAALLLLLSGILAFAGSQVPMDQVELQRTTTDPTVVRVAEKTTGATLACYQLGSASEVSALIAMAPDLDVYDTTTNVMRAALTTAPDQISQTAEFANPTLDGYDGGRTLTIRVAPTLTIQRLMSSQAEAEQLSRLLQQGALVASRTTDLAEQPTDHETYSIDLDTPLASCP